MDIKVPERKREIAIDFWSKSQHIMYLYATQDAAEDMWQFGFVRAQEGKPDLYQLEVDMRFEFDEVLYYIEHYGEVAKLDMAIWGEVIHE